MMITLQEQQKVHRRWLQAAHGDLGTVERAIVRATERARPEHRPATSSEVLEAIQQVSLQKAPLERNI